MKAQPILIGVVALALAACGAPDANEMAAGDSAPANGATPDDGTAAQVAASGTAPTREYLIGRWTDNGECADALDFRADGTLGASSEEIGRWELRGDRLVNVGDPLEITLAVIDQDTMEATHPEGETRRVTRCP